MGARGRRMNPTTPDGTTGARTHGAPHGGEGSSRPGAVQGSGEPVAAGQSSPGAAPPLASADVGACRTSSGGPGRPEAARTAAAAGQTTIRRQPPREVVRGHACPRCGAAPGELCRGRRGPRKSNHIERVRVVWDLVPQKLPRSARTSLPNAGSELAVKARSADPEGVDRQGADGIVPEVLAADGPR